MGVDVSIIIPTYNRAAYLVKAIDSALGQTFLNREIIVVDDGSTDDTRRRVEAYGDRVKYVLTTNGGVAHARNVGTAHSTGKYLTFLDSDDLLYPYALELEAAVLDRYPDVGMVYAEMSGFDDDGFFERYHLKAYHESAYRDRRVTYDRIFPSSRALDDTDLIPASLLSEDPGVGSRRAYFGRIFDWYLTRIVVFQNSLMLRQSILPAIGMRNERVRYWQELDYAMRICRSQQVCFIDVPTYKLRYHAEQISTTSRADGRGKYVWLRKQQILLRVIKRHALSDSGYYQRHQARIDRHLAHLHCAVAVPMLLQQDSGPDLRNYPKRARLYLNRCRLYGHPERLLWWLSLMPGPLRRLGVSILVVVRKKLASQFPGGAPVEP